VYAVNYNVLRVMSGMGGLSYSSWCTVWVVLLTYKLNKQKQTECNQRKRLVTELFSLITCVQATKLISE
jgi:hypothetical protein